MRDSNYAPLVVPEAADLKPALPEFSICVLIVEAAVVFEPDLTLIEL